ncbi:unnamed protein product [Kuraishia capsulata CBS 1993]|uniref:Rhodanese domain-containing protein n=1 Tax=Kuraishia capsulata CBS 1993 TaxID=1382522 RepID=W6MIH8_9ASCO|nr:uncharacterized protein KUCA_T00001678001 [Kuraishia capsulata CBS 1993]CDK25708.1 unnamed protein product [Kuraishia capsulata CBS 1993]
MGSLSSKSGAETEPKTTTDSMLQLSLRSATNGFKNVSKFASTFGSKYAAIRTISIVSAAGVSKLRELPSLVPVDSTWYMPNSPQNGLREYLEERLSADTVFFDIDAIKDPASPYPHMLPSAEDFDKSVSKLGIKNGDSLLIYDNQGIFSSCRAAWMFEVFGHDISKINLLNTYPIYKETNNAVDNDTFESESPLAESDYKHAKFDKTKVIDYEELLELVKAEKIGPEYTLLDARSTPRFTGEAPEPRAGLSSGHVPGAISVPFTDLLGSIKDGFLSQTRLQIYFQAKGIDDSKPFIVMCGTGVTACILKYGLEIAGLGQKGIRVYDGSWTEWAQRAEPEYIQKV